MDFENRSSWPHFMLLFEVMAMIIFGLNALRDEHYRVMALQLELGTSPVPDLSFATLSKTSTLQLDGILVWTYISLVLLIILVLVIIFSDQYECFSGSELNECCLLKRFWIWCTANTFSSLQNILKTSATSARAWIWELGV